MKMKYLTNLQKLQAMHYEPEQLETIEDDGLYSHIVVAYDNFLSGWGKAQGKDCLTILLVHNMTEVRTAIEKMEQNNFKRFNYYRLDDDKGIAYLQSQRKNRIYVLRIIEDCPLWQ